MARADAARNADRLLSAARELVSEQGAEVPLDEVAKRAGVGNATLYRHFPTRADLLVAVYADEVDRLVRLGAEADLFTWLDAYVEHVTTKRALATAATDETPGRRAELSGRWHQTIIETATALVARAAPQLRPGLTAKDLLALATGVALTATDPATARRLLALVRTGVQR
jgi:AcrR family transcriptional regulator